MSAERIEGGKSQGIPTGEVQNVIGRQMPVEERRVHIGAQAQLGFDAEQQKRPATPVLRPQRAENTDTGRPRTNETVIYRTSVSAMNKEPDEVRQSVSPEQEGTEAESPASVAAELERLAGEEGLTRRRRLRLTKSIGTLNEHLGRTIGKDELLGLVQTIVDMVPESSEEQPPVTDEQKVKALAKFSSDGLTVAWLRYHEGLTQTQAAQLLGKTPSAVHNIDTHLQAHLSDATGRVVRLGKQIETAQLMRQVRELYAQGASSPSQVAKELNVKTHQVKWVLKNLRERGVL